MALHFEVIPAIDLIDGKCVRLIQGDYARPTVYSDDPVGMAKRWQDDGAVRLHVVDLDGAKSGVPRNLEVASRIARALSIPSDIGGGIRTMESARMCVDAGFQRFSIGTKALDEDFASEVFEEFGDAAILDIASRDGKVAVAGWQEQSEVDAVDLALRLTRLGCRRIIYTDIARDGSLRGPNLTAMTAMADSVAVPVVASGGVSSVNDLLSLGALHAKGIEGAIVGKALYDGRIDLAEAIRSVAASAR